MPWMTLISLVLVASFGPIVVIGLGFRAAIASVGRNPMAAPKIFRAMLLLCGMSTCTGAVGLWLILALFGGPLPR